MTGDLADLERAVRESGVDHVFLEFPDLNGLSRGKQLRTEYFLDGLDDGFSMNVMLLAASALDDWPEGSGYGESINYADGTVYPLPGTFERLPWRERAGRVLCEFEFEGEPLPIYSRRVLRDVLADAPWELSAGSELEFMLLRETGAGREPVTAHNHECVNWAAERVGAFYDTLSDWADAFGIPVNLLHHEDGAGQLEVLFDHSGVLAQADRAFDFRRLVMEVAAHHDRTATFLPKPFTDGPGNGLHVHLSAFEDGENVLADGDALSETGRQFVAGVLEHADALVALTCPTLNSLKRVRSGGFAPGTRSWGYRNRTTSVRVPDSGTTRVETRIPGADANPYVALAATLAAGLHGVRAGLDPGEPVDGNASGRRPPLPRSPELVLRALEDDDVMRDALGDEFVDVFAAVKRRELDLFFEHVTDWEKRYLDIV